MNNIAIITLNGYFNYGNRLQNYALQESLKLINYDSKTLIKENIIEENGISESKLKIFFNMSYKEKIELIKYKINKGKIIELNKNRTQVFKMFSEDYINEADFQKNDDFIKKYKYFISGSDQVWNPNDKTVTEYNFLTFAPKEKRLTYAPSFGVSKIPEKFKEDYKKWLSDIENISVREEAGAKIIKELTGKNAKIVVDPTMLLDKKKWLSIAKEDKNKPQKEYLLTYFLGGIPKEYQKNIKYFSKKYNLEVVNLANIKYEKYYCNGPSEFIDYINSAKLFMTDSFHGCVFSLLMETPFIVCDRKGHSKSENMSSRIDTFVKKFKLESRKFENIKENELFNNDYTNSKTILEKEREKAWNYLNSIIK
ncbi:TPA: polysaccharide pyruvyl transferase family protein [Clostridium perfringens]